MHPLIKCIPRNPTRDNQNQYQNHPRHIKLLPYQIQLKVCLEKISGLIRSHYCFLVFQNLSETLGTENRVGPGEKRSNSNLPELALHCLI